MKTQIMETNRNIHCKSKIGNCKLTVTCKLETSQINPPTICPGMKSKEQTKPKDTRRMQIKKFQIKTSEMENTNTTERDGFELVLKISRYL